MYYRNVPPCMMWGQMPMAGNNQNVMPMNTMPMQYMPSGIMPMQNTPSGIMPMQNTPVDDKDLEMMYPKSYFAIMPMVKMHCDKMEGKYGVFFCPSKDEMEGAVEDIYERLDKDMDDEDEKCKKNKKDNKCREDESLDGYEDDMRQRHRFGRRRLFRDLIRILLLEELLGRRRRRRPQHGYGGY